MKCACQVDCQIRLDDGIIKFFKRGQVWEFKECPPHFEVLDGPPDFSTASEEVLYAADYDLQDLKDYIFDTYGKKAGARGLEKTIEILLDCRYREI